MSHNLQNGFNPFWLPYRNLSHLAAVLNIPGAPLPAMVAPGQAPAAPQPAPILGAPNVVMAPGGQAPAAPSLVPQPSPILAGLLQNQNAAPPSSSSSSSTAPAIDPIQCLRMILNLGTGPISKTPLTKIPKNSYILFLSFVKELKERGVVNEMLDAHCIWSQSSESWKQQWKKVWERHCLDLHVKISKGQLIRAKPMRRSRF